MLGEAKEQAEIDEEKEIVETSTIQAMGKNKFGNIEQSELQAFLDSNAGEGKTETIDGEDTLVVKFIESSRYYEVDSNGNVSEPVEIVVDNYAGDLTKGGRCDGSEEKPFEINCIEDLVAFSIMTNGGNSELGLISSNFNGKYVVLTRTLDFNSIISYSDFTTIKYGDLNTDGTIENIKIELTKKNEVCIGFTPMKIFLGTFNGNNCEIKNIYENKYGIAGLFENLGYGAKISNLTISGNITSIDGQAAGLVGNAGNRSFTLGEVIIENCTNKANINANTYAGGILTSTTMYIQPIVNNCNNFGNILSKTASA